jgi:acetylornithine/N-succinyldiaminopimelate aminotransferase
MPSADDLVAIAKKNLYGNYRPAPVVFSRGRGCELFDVEGKRYLDLSAGVAVCSVGHAHPVLARAIAEQAAAVMHVSNYFFNEPNVLLASELCRLTKMDRVLFCNSGTEANEAALKLVRHHFYGLGQKSRGRIIAFENSFHGRTLGALSMTGTAKYREGFGELPGVAFVRYGDIDGVKRVLSDEVAGIFVEPLQGEGGVFPAPTGFLTGLRELCSASGALLVADEVQTGVGRLGHFLAVHGLGVSADVVTLAKGLGGGFPIGAMLSTEKLASALPPGTHGTTFGGNPLASRAALAVLSIVRDEGLIDAAQARGKELGAALRAVVASLPSVCVEARGQGLLWGLVLREGLVARDVLAKLLGNGVLLTAAGERVLRFSPPLVVTSAQIDEGVAVLRSVLSELAQ